MKGLLHKKIEHGIRVKLIVDITEFRVTSKTNYRALRCINTRCVVDHERANRLSFSISCLFRE
jgi:hypothetical protein